MRPHSVTIQLLVHFSASHFVGEMSALLFKNLYWIMNYVRNSCKWSRWQTSQAVVFARRAASPDSALPKFNVLKIVLQTNRCNRTLLLVSLTLDDCISFYQNLQCILQQMLPHNVRVGFCSKSYGSFDVEKLHQN